MIWEEGGTDISRLPVTPFNTVINPDVTNWWPGAGEFHQPPLCPAIMDFPPFFRGLTVTIVFWEGGWNSWMVTFKIPEAIWARKESGSPPHSKEGADGRPLILRCSVKPNPKSMLIPSCMCTTLYSLPSDFICYFPDLPFILVGEGGGERLGPPFYRRGNLAK